MSSEKQKDTRRLVFVSVMMLAAPVLLVASWLVWANWHWMDASNVLLLAAIPSMFTMQVGLDRLVARPLMKSLTVRVPLKKGTRKHLPQSTPFVIYVYAAALTTILQMVWWWDVMLRLLAFWILTVAVIEHWTRYHARASISKVD